MFKHPARNLPLNHSMNELSVGLCGYKKSSVRSAVTNFIKQNNADPKPFRWSKSAADILASTERFCVFNAPAKV